jgi:hypothetical protein
MQQDYGKIRRASVESMHAAQRYIRRPQTTFTSIEAKSPKPMTVDCSNTRFRAIKRCDPAGDNFCKSSALRDFTLEKQGLAAQSRRSIFPQTQVVRGNCHTLRKNPLNFLAAILRQQEFVSDRNDLYGLAIILPPFGAWCNQSP